MSRSPNTPAKPMDGNDHDRHSGSSMDKEHDAACATPDPISKQMAEAARKPTSGWSGTTPHLFHLSTWSPNALEGGSITGANEENFPILKGQNCSIYIARLEPHGVREPHWHMDAWEVNFVVSGKVKWSFLGPKASYDTFEAEQGDVVFIPRGEFHYFENASETEDLVVLVVFNTSASEPNDDIGIVGSLSSMPADVLGSLFKVSPDLFRNMHHQHSSVVIFKKK